MVATIAIALALWLAAPAKVDTANHHGQAPSRLTWSALSSASLAAGKTGQEPAPKKKPQEVTAEGRVKHRDGKPAAGARIAVTRPDGSSVEAYADRGGKFQVTGPEGRYSLVIQAADKRGEFAATLAKDGLTPSEFILR